MESRKGFEQEKSLMLTAPEGVPFPFSVIIRNAWQPVHASCTFEIKGTRVDQDLLSIESYHLPNRDHETYLDFFAQLANDFGMRLPQNRRVPFKPSFEAPYREVLLHNLAPGMLYGYGDPAVIRVGEEQEPVYYLLVTSNDAPDAFPILRSPDLVDWTFVGYVFPRGHKPAWAAEGALISDFWAPELHQFGDEFRVYFVARDKHSHELCIGVARSSNPEGPFVADNTPLLSGNVIDPHIFQTGDGTAFLYWKKDNNDLWPQRLIELLYRYPAMIAELFKGGEDQVTASFIITIWPWIQLLEPIERFLATQVFIEAVTGNYLSFYEQLCLLQQRQPPGAQQIIASVLLVMKTPVYAQQLAADGSGLAGTPLKIIENDLAWEAHLVEGIWMTEQNGRYYLFYAGNDFSTDQYGIGVAIAGSPLGPFQKLARPILQTSVQWWSPGHPSLALDRDGKPQLLLHAYHPGKAGYKQFRALLSTPVTFEADGVRVG